jgi:FXSXX-COOH protein
MCAERVRPSECTDDIETQLPDLTEVPLGEVTQVLAGPALELMLSRVFPRHEGLADPVVAFQSSI